MLDMLMTHCEDKNINRKHQSLWKMFSMKRQLGKAGTILVNTMFRADCKNLSIISLCCSPCPFHEEVSDVEVSGQCLVSGVMVSGIWKILSGTDWGKDIPINTNWRHFSFYFAQFYFLFLSILLGFPIYSNYNFNIETLIKILKNQ